MRWAASLTLVGHQLADRGDVLGQPEMHVAERIAHLIGLVHQGFALAGEVFDQAADAQLVVIVGAFERGDLVVHQQYVLVEARR